jgi:hypothetical protein
MPAEVAVSVVPTIEQPVAVLPFASAYVMAPEPDVPVVVKVTVYPVPLNAVDVAGTVIV